MDSQKTEQGLETKSDHELLAMLVVELQSIRQFLEDTAGYSLNVSESREGAWGATYTGQIIRKEVFKGKSVERTSPPTDPFAQQLMSLLRQGKATEAINLYRKQRGADLQDAQDAIDDLKRWL